MTTENKFKKTQANLKKLKYEEGVEHVLVSYSGGKDSLVVLDMASKIFKVTCFFMYFIKNLRCVEDQLEYARQRYKVEILQYPHWVLSRALLEGVYCDNYDLPFTKETKLIDIYNLVRKDTGITHILTGAKAADSLWRKRNLYCITNSKKYQNIINPIVDWNKFDVLAYLQINKIPLPPSSGKKANGIDLSTPSLLWLHDTYPDDFQKLLEIFPYAMAAIKRREYYGIK